MPLRYTRRVMHTMLTARDSELQSELVREVRQEQRGGRTDVGDWRDGLGGAELRGDDGVRDDVNDRRVERAS